MSSQYWPRGRDSIWRRIACATRDVEGQCCGFRGLVNLYMISIGGISLGLGRCTFPIPQSLSCLTPCTVGILYRLALDFSSTEYVNSCNLWQPFILNVPHFSTEFLSFEISMPEGITREFPVRTRVGDSMYCSFVSRFD